MSNEKRAANAVGEEVPGADRSIGSEGPESAGSEGPESAGSEGPESAGSGHAESFGSDFPEQMIVRRAKRSRLLESGAEPYPVTVP